MRLDDSNPNSKNRQTGPIVEAFVSNAWIGAWHKHRHNALRVNRLVENLQNE